MLDVDHTYDAEDTNRPSVTGVLSERIGVRDPLDSSMAPCSAPLPSLLPALLLLLNGICGRNLLYGSDGRDSSSGWLWLD